MGKYELIKKMVIEELRKLDAQEEEKKAEEKKAEENKEKKEMKKRKEKKEENSTKCEVCNLTFSRVDSLRRHKKNPCIVHHPL